MTNMPTPLSSRRTSFGQAVIPLALLALVALVGGLVYHTRALEGSHRATAENALRDYAALAAWQYNEQAELRLASLAHASLSVIHPWFRGNRRPLPGPEVLVRFGNPDTCGLGPSARFTFRIDLPSGNASFAGAPPDENSRRAIVDRFTQLAHSGRLTRETIRLFADTVGGAARAVAYAVILSADSVPSVVYGMDADPEALVQPLTGILGARPLLPPSLLRGRSTDSVLMLQVRRVDGAVLTTIGSASDERLAAEQTMSHRAGSLVTRVVVRPEAASTLLIGGLPASRLDMLTLLLAGSIVLAGIALFQIRRGRELARLRTKFVANVSHELRTPLSQISMFSETLLLQRERSREERQEFLSVIFREARRLSHLVESVLRFSRTDAQAGGYTPRAEPRDVARDVSDAVRAFYPLVATAGVQLRTVLGERSIARVERDALRQVVINLLDNAVKFGPEQQQVLVSVARVGTEIVVAVTDEGPGIPRSERRKLFEPFAQGTGARSRTTAGAGIGLAVVSDLAAAHGGRAWIEDGPANRGARVAVAFPAVPDEPVPNESESENEARDDAAVPVAT